MNNPSPLVSVVMPVYNQERYVADAVRSVLAQRFSEFEFIIVDDGSTDQTLEILRTFRDGRIRIIQQPNAGFISALLNGYHAARGEWIARMDSDDLSHPDRLAKQFEFLSAHPECAFVGTAYGFVTPNDRFAQPVNKFAWRFVEPAQITLGGRIFGDPTVMFHHATAASVGYYDSEFENENPLWYRLLKVKKGAVLGEILYYNRWRMGSVSRGGINEWQKAYYPIRNKYDSENAAKMKVRPSFNHKKALTRQVRKGVAIYLRAGDRSAALRLAWSAWKTDPFCAVKTKLLSYAFLGIEGVRIRQVRASASRLVRHAHPLLPKSEFTTPGGRVKADNNSELATDSY